MKKRIRKKIQRRFEDLDHTLDQCFACGRQRYWLLIEHLRGEIQYLRRRYPLIYFRTFGLDLDIGHFMAGRRD
jgi:hypothetical protein